MRWNKAKAQALTEKFIKESIDGLTDAELQSRFARLGRIMDDTTGPLSYAFVRDAWDETRVALSRRKVTA